MITGNNNVHEYLLVDSIKLFSHHKYYSSAAAASVGKCPESDYYIYCLVWLVWDSGSQKSVWIILLQYMRNTGAAYRTHLYAGAACLRLHCGDHGDGGGNCLLSYINVSVSQHWPCELKLAWLLSFLHCHHAFLAQFLSLVWSYLDLNSVEYKTYNLI